MCGIAGFFKMDLNYLENKKKWIEILNDMNNVQKHRGPDEQDIFISQNCGLAHVRLSIVDLKNGKQPMTGFFKGEKLTIVYNGEIYNTKELKEELKEFGVIFKTTSDTEVILMGHLVFGDDFVKKLNGIFAYAIFNETKKEFALFRDRVGVKPLFYTIFKKTLIFASEIKAIFKYPKIKKQIDKEGLCEIFGLGPARTLGKGVFKDIFELLPGHYLKVRKNSIKQVEYWALKAKPHKDSFKKTVEKTEFLITDSVKRQLVADIPICTFLSGGVDSSLISSIAAFELKNKGEKLNTFSFDYVDNEKYFESNFFQPSQDKPWVEKMVSYLKTNHEFLECNTQELLNNLFVVVDARDLPCMADVESSLLFFCSKVSKKNKVALTGECADEIFGGYPWFFKEEMLNSKTFPWSLNLNSRKLLLKEDVLNFLNLDEYVQMEYEKTICNVPKLYGETKKEEKIREISFLNLKWFMVNLLERMDRTSMFCGLEARVPFADHRLLEYVFNMPFEFKFCNRIAKGILRKSAEKHLLHEVVYRKKSPYPKTYNPEYEKKLKTLVLEVISNSNSPILNLVDKKKLEDFLKNKKNYTTPWFGQLMAGPQMLAYLLQINYWFLKYDVEIV